MRSFIFVPMTIDLQGAETKQAVHERFRISLNFPEWYGPNWDAFWDCIIAVVPMPAEVRLVNWQSFAEACPRDMAILRQVVQDYAEAMPSKQLVLA
jgi:RNAse (barnase) inhibitor barstar